MARRKYPCIENLAITTLAAEGKAMGKYNGKVVFVPYTAPGDIVNVQVTNSRSGYMEGVATAFIHQSETRVKPFCSHFGICGGCKWQHIPYSEQLAYKQQQVLDQLTRIGKFNELNLLPILGAANAQYYRNKLEFTFSNKRWMTAEEIAAGTLYDDMDALGFHIPGMFDKVLDIHNCWLQNDISNQIRLEIKRCCKENHYSFFDLRNQQGLMRNLIIRPHSRPVRQGAGH